MTDIRRTLLWVVFTMSLVLLWDAWNRHSGHPTLFGAPMKTAAAPGGAAPGSTGGTAAPAVAGGVPQPATLPGGAAAAGAVLPGAAVPPLTAALPAAELVVLTTDVVKATFDSIGGTLVRLELLGYRDPLDAQRKVVLFERNAKRLYLAQTGLITAQAGVSLPNHLTPMVAAPCP